MTWTSPAPAPADGPLTGPVRPLLQGMLDFQRSTLLNICAGLTAEQLAERPIEPSNLSLLGLVRHLTKVERIWWRIRAAGEDVAGVFDHEPGKDADFELIDPADAENAVEQLQQEWRLGDAAVAGLDLDHPVPSRDETLSLQLVYIHLVQEYARHNGHADLLRQRIDGVTGR